MNLSGSAFCWFSGTLTPAYPNVLRDYHLTALVLISSSVTTLRLKFCWPTGTARPTAGPSRSSLLRLAINARKIYYDTYVTCAADALTFCDLSGAYCCFGGWISSKVFMVIRLIVFLSCIFVSINYTQINICNSVWINNMNKCYCSQEKASVNRAIYTSLVSWK